MHQFAVYKQPYEPLSRTENLKTVVNKEQEFDQ